MTNNARNKMYNEEIKEWFMNQYNEDSQHSFKYIFYKTYETESFYEKDIKDFNTEEFDDLLYSMDLSSKSSAESTMSVFRKYLEFCKKNNLIEEGISLVEFDSNFSGTRLFQYVSKLAEEKKIMTREEIFEIAENCDNAQDGVIPGLLFEGVSNQRDLEEIIMLKKQDVYEEDGKHWIDIRGEMARTIEISERLYGVVQDAINQNAYQFRLSEDSKKHAITALDLLETDFLIRPTKRNNKASVFMVDPQLVRSRLSRLKEDYNNMFITPASVWLSGQVDYGKQLKKEFGVSELSLEHYKMINKKFGYKEVYVYKTKKKIGEYI